MNARKIDMNDWTLFGGGAVGESFNHVSDPALMLKLYFETYPKERVLQELELANAVKNMGITTPEPGEFVTDGSRYGIIFRRILNKKSFSRAIADDASLLEPLVKRFAEMCRKLHATKCTAKNIPSYKDFYLEVLKENTYIAESDKPIIAERIKQMPDAHYCVHGDLHIGNVITDGNKDYFIDLGEFMSGNPLIDISMMYFVTHTDNPFTEHVFHLKPATMHKVWEVFFPAYFGEGADEAAIVEEMGPYFALRTIAMEVDANRTEPEFEVARKKYLLY